MSLHRGQAVNLTGWISMITMCLAVLLKVFSKVIKIKTVQLDDYFLLCAMVFAVAQTVANSEAVHYGLGKPEDQLDPSSLAGFEKSLYASQILFVPAVVVPKIATAVFVGRLSVERIVRTAASAIQWVCTAWLVCGLLVTAIQCSPFRTWDVTSGRCIDFTAFWAAMAAVDILLDVAQLGIIIYICWKLQMARTLKLSIFTAFAARLVITPLSILRVIYIRSAYSSPDLSYGFYDAALVTELIVNVGIIIHCVPFVRPVTNSLEHGFFSTDLRNTLRVNSITSLDPSQTSSRRRGIKLQKHALTARDDQELLPV